MTFELDAGKIQQGIFEKYASFFSMFNEPADHEIEDIFAKVWLGIDMRTQEKFIERAKAIHSLIAKEKVDISMALFEIMVVRFQNIYAGKDLYWIPKINKATYGGMERTISKAMIDYLKKLQTRACSGRTLWTGSTQQREGLLDDVVGNTFFILARTYCGNDGFYSEAGDKYNKEVALAKEFRKIVDIVQ